MLFHAFVILARIGCSPLIAAIDLPRTHRATSRPRETESRNEASKVGEGIHMLPMPVHDISKMTTLASRLRLARKEKGWTQMQLAEKTGSTQAVIQKIENGKSLRPRNVVKLAQVLGVSPAWLMFGQESFDELDDEAIEMATAWSKLHEPHRSSIKQAILKIVARNT